MFGLGRNDDKQRAAVEKFRALITPLDGGYLYPSKRNGETVLLSEKQRDELVEYYAQAVNRAMWVLVTVTLAGIFGMAIASMIWDFRFHFWAMMLLAALGTAPTLTIPARLRRKIAEFGPLRSAAPQNVEMLRLERLRKKPWSTILAPGVVIIVLALQWHPHMPPQDADDWSETAMMLALAGVWVWAVLKKLRAARLTLG